VNPMEILLIVCKVTSLWEGGTLDRPKRGKWWRYRGIKNLFSLFTACIGERDAVLYAGDSWARGGWAQGQEKLYAVDRS